MKDSDIDDILKRAAGATRDVDPALLDRISQSIGRSPGAVRPLPSSWILASGLVLICAVVALTGGMLFKPYGVQKMNALEAGVIFSVLGILVSLAAVLCVAEVVPGSRRPLPPWMLLLAACAGLAAVFALLFHDYSSDRFISQGMRCLTTGLLHALPASLATAWLLSRGFAVSSIDDGLAKGTLAGMAGVAMLELHCPNFEAPHVLVWHVAVLAVSGVVGALVGWTIRAYRERAVPG